MAKKNKGQQVATYFLATKSGLFAPGAAVILANASMKAAAPKQRLGVRLEGQKASKWHGGGSGGVVSSEVIQILDNVHWYIYGF